MTTSPPEQSRGESPAGQAELSELFIRSKGWLEHNGSQFIDDPDLVLGEARGLPISNVCPRLFYTIPGDVVREYAAAAADTLNIGDSFTLVYKQPHYAEENPGKPDTRLVRQTPKAEFTRGLLTSQMQTETFRIELTVDDEFEEQFVDERHSEIRSLFGMAAHSDGAEVGNRMTMQEYKALDEILDSLDLMKDAVDAAQPS